MLGLPSPISFSTNTPRSYKGRCTTLSEEAKFHFANKATKKVRDLASNANNPLGEKNFNVVRKYGIISTLEKLTGNRRPGEKFHQDKVRMKNGDIAAGNIK